MAEDHVLDWLIALRERPHRGVPDLALIAIARHLGAVDEGGNPEHSHYSAPGDLSDAQLDAIISSLKAEYDFNSVPVGESVGVVTGQSVGESSVQATLRTFHYAGVAKGVPPADLFSKQMGIRQNPYHIAIALSPEHAFSHEKAMKLANGLKRGRLGDVVDIELGSQRYFDLRGDFSDDSVWLQDGNYDEAWPVFSQLMESGQIVVSSGHFSPNDLSHLLHSILTDYDDPAGFPGLRSQIQFGRVEIDGEERLSISAPHLGSRLVKNLMEVMADTEICNNCNSPYNYLKFQQIGKQKRRDPVLDEIESVDSKEYDARVHGMDWQEYEAKRILGATGFVSNPSEEAPTFGSPDWILGVRKAWVQDPARYRWSLAKRDQSNCCKMCGLGWTLDDVQVHQWGASYLGDDYWGDEDIEESVETRELEIDAGYGRIPTKGVWHSKDLFCRPDICDDDPCQREYIYTRTWYERPRSSVYGMREGRKIMADWDKQKGVWLGPKKEVGDDGSAKWATNKEDAVEDQMSYPRADGTDYPVTYLHDGAVINDGKEGEWYIVVRGHMRESKMEGPSLIDCGRLTKPPARFRGVDMKTLPTKGKGSFAGYFARLDGDDRFDFMRSSCDCPVQVFHALGIEACRAVWLHNLYGTFSRSPELLQPNKLVPSDSIPVHIKHYMMLVDACCSGVIPMHIRGSDASVSGNASQKGSNSIARNGSIENYVDALSIASYERPVEVLLGSQSRQGLAQMGVTDAISSVKSQQIVGEWGRSRRMSPWHTYYDKQAEYDRLIEVLSEMRKSGARIDELALAELDVTVSHQLCWWEYIGTPQAEMRKEVYDSVMSVPGVEEEFRRLRGLEIEWRELAVVFGLD